MDFLAASAVTVAGGTTVHLTRGVGAPQVASMCGISSSGIKAGSVAARAQSYAGNIPAGSVLSKLQSTAMSGHRK